jgi:hypothetical protein
MSKYAVVVFEDKSEESEKASAALEGTNLQQWGSKSDLLGASMVFGKPLHFSHTHVDAFPTVDLEGKIIACKERGMDISLAVVTDLMMPAREGGPDGVIPAGVFIAFECIKRGIPVVVCTTYLHGMKDFGWINDLLRTAGVPVVEDKNWDRAVELLATEIKKKQEATK